MAVASVAPAPTAEEWVSLDNVMAEITATRATLDRLLAERARMFIDLTERAGVSQSAIAERYDGVINQKAISKAILAYKLRQLPKARKGTKTTKGTR